MNTYLLDTNIIIDFLKGDKRTADILQSIKSNHKNNQLCISVITVAEYNFGAWRSSDTQKALAAFTTLCVQADVSVIEINTQIAETFAIIQAKLAKQGRLRPVFDLLIASSCIVHNYTLVTHNKKDFVGIGELKILEM